ncbi:hypothetical protein IWW48_004385 [Coemansia sp. RSA 1200]|nr:hypothetical protein IWW48_004385 [Coemansia sp. RSA 1200]
MAEPVAYENSPLAQYLHEIEAAEEPVADKDPYEGHRFCGGTAENDAEIAVMSRRGGRVPWRILNNSRIASFLRLVAQQITVGLLHHPSSERRVVAGIAADAWNRVAGTLACSGHLDERYTPKRIRPYNDDYSGDYDGMRGLWSWTGRCGRHSFVIGGGVCAALAILVAVGSRLFVAERHRLLGRATLIAGTAATAAATLVAVGVARTRRRARETAQAAERLVKDVRELSVDARRLDVSVQSAVRFIQEIVFVTRGLRIPQHTATTVGSRIPSRAGHGMRWAGSHLHKTTIDALAGSTRPILAALDTVASAAESKADEPTLQLCNRATVLALRKEEAAALDQCNHTHDDGNNGDSRDNSPVDQMQRLFSLHFAARKLWFETILMALEPVFMTISGEEKEKDGDGVVTAVVDRDVFLANTGAICTEVDRVLVAVASATDRISAAREAQYTARRWESVASATAETATSQPVVRCLASMADATTTIGAKLVVCRDAVELPDAGESFDNVARVFASLKKDIDALGALYQETMTTLVFAGEEANGAPITTIAALGNDQGDGSWHADDVQADHEDNAWVFGCSPLGADGMDTSGLVFESDPAHDPSPSMRRGQQGPVVDRSERIRLQRQKREDEERQRQRVGEVHSMMSELRTAISTRGGERQQAE